MQSPEASGSITGAVNPLRAWLVIITGHETATYDASEFQIEFPNARAFELVKRGGTEANGDERYSVLIADEHSTCECWGFLRHGHCKHVESLTALIAAGHLQQRPELVRVLDHPCPACRTREGGEHNRPCAVCAAQINEDLAALSAPTDEHQQTHAA